MASEPVGPGSEGHRGDSYPVDARGEKDPTCVGPVGRFLALVGDDASDRARLLHIVRTLRRDRDEPLPADIADRLEHAVESNIHVRDEVGER